MILISTKKLAHLTSSPRNEWVNSHKRVRTQLVHTLYMWWPSKCLRKSFRNKSNFTINFLGTSTLPRYNQQHQIFLMYVTCLRLDSTVGSKSSKSEQQQRSGRTRKSQTGAFSCGMNYYHRRRRRKRTGTHIKRVAKKTFSGEKQPESCIRQIHAQFLSTLFPFASREIL